MYKVSITTQTGSMKPTITGYDLTIIQTNYEYSKIEEGDIIAYEYGCSINEPVFESNIFNNVFNNTKSIMEVSISHRVVKETKNGYVTKGDNNNYIDQKTECVDHITKEEYNGKIVDIIQLDRNKLVILLIGIFILSFIILYILKFFLFDIIIKHLTPDL